jgi:AP-1 complex subunit gamma-1
MLSYSDEYLINDVTDPFLQISMLQFFRICLEGSSEVDKSLQELLDCLPVETKIKKNTGNAVLYECAITILKLNVDANIKQTAMEIISRMLGYKDVNSTYISLDLLRQMALEIKTTNFEHLEIVLDCLRENDSSIKKLSLRAMEVLANRDNVQSNFFLIRFLILSHRQGATELPNRMR